MDMAHSNTGSTQLCSSAVCTLHCTTWPPTSEGNAGRKQADVRMQAGFLKAFSPATGEYLSMAFQVQYALSMEP